jgi:hypothetical protein
VRAAFIALAAGLAAGGPASETADESGARASSMLEPASEFAAAHVADGDPLTAWCEGAPGNGKGQWVEVSLERPFQEGTVCQLASVNVLPGRAVPTGQHARGRPTKIRVSACGGSPPFVDRKVPALTPDALTEWVGVGLPRNVKEGLYPCVRITILAARENQTCISEVAPFITGCVVLLR